MLAAILWLRRQAGPACLHLLTWSSIWLTKLRYLRSACDALMRLRAFPKTIAVFLPEPGHLHYVGESLNLMKDRGYHVHAYTKPEHIHFYRTKLKAARVYPYPACTMVRYPLVFTPSTPFSANSYRHPGSMVVHLPHSMVSLHVVFQPTTFSHFDALLSCGPHHCAEIAAIFKHLGRKGQIFPVGYQRIDDIAKAEAPRKYPKLRPVVLIAPTWGKISLLARFGVSLIDSLISDFDIILRPHFWQLSQWHEQLEAIVDKYGEHSGFRLDISNDSTDALLAADVMISDYSGIAFEFAFARLRPVVFVEGPRKCFNEQWRQLYPEEAVEYRCRFELGTVVPDLTNVIPAVQDLIASQSDWEQRLRQARSRHLHHFGHAGEKTADALELLFKGRDVRRSSLV